MGSIQVWDSEDFSSQKLEASKFSIILPFFILQKGMSPVHYAAARDRADIVKLFYEKKPHTLYQKNSVGFKYNFR